jgi:hypothetical protein
MNNELITSLLNALQAPNPVIVTFTTKKGHTRLMRCSKYLPVVPESQHEGRFNFRLNGDLIICVYDFDNSDWRAFRKDSVVSFEVG